MGAIIDIIGSLVIRAVIVIVMLNLSVSLQTTLYQKTSRAVVKQSVASTAQTVIADMKLIGYNASSPMQNATPDDIQFLAAIDSSNGPVKLVHYYTSVQSTSPKRMVLYRQINGGAPQEVGRDIDSLVFSYYDSIGNVPPNLADIRSVKLRFSVASKDSFAGFLNSDTKVFEGVWERQFFPKNLN